MEPQETIYCCNKEPKCYTKNKCLGVVATILLTAFSVVIGLIVGAAVSATILSAIAAIIVLAVILGLLLVLDIVLIFCNKKKKDKKYKCCC